MGQTIGRGAAGRVAPPVPRISGTPGHPQRGRPMTAGFPLTLPAKNSLYSLRPSAIWKVLKRQPPSFWLFCIYLFFEYIRPQQIYEAILGPPYARIAIILAFVA